MTTKSFIAAKTFIEHQGRVLVVRESSNYKEGTQTGLFDLVGGRVNPDESLLDGLKREVKEEVGLEVDEAAPFFVDEVWRELNDEKLHVVRVYFRCNVDTDTVKLGSDHDEYKWIEPKKFEQEQIIQNLYPAFSRYIENKHL